MQPSLARLHSRSCSRAYSWAESWAELTGQFTYGLTLGFLAGGLVGIGLIVGQIRPRRIDLPWRRIRTRSAISTRRLLGAGGIGGGGFMLADRFELGLRLAAAIGIMLGFVTWPTLTIDSEEQRAVNPQSFYARTACPGSWSCSHLGSGSDSRLDCCLGSQQGLRRADGWPYGRVYRRVGKPGPGPATIGDQGTHATASNDLPPRSPQPRWLRQAGGIYQFRHNRLQDQLANPINQGGAP